MSLFLKLQGDECGVITVGKIEHLLLAYKAICIFRTRLGVAVPSLPDYLCKSARPFQYGCWSWPVFRGDPVPASVLGGQDLPILTDCSYPRMKHGTECVVAA